MTLTYLAQSSFASCAGYINDRNVANPQRISTSLSPIHHNHPPRSCRHPVFFPPLPSISHLPTTSDPMGGFI